MAEELAGDATRLPEEETRVDRNAAATFMERYAERLVRGPAVKEFSHPINRNRYEPDIAAAIRAAIYSLAQAVRAGVDEPEADWPLPQAVAYFPVML